MARPIAARRHDEIIRRVATSGTVSVEELARHFSVSRETIRRDFKALSGLGRLDIVHGGAVRKIDETALAQRRTENPDGKAAIGRRAARLVEDGMVVLFDSGATTLAVAEALAGRPDGRPVGLTVCTNSLAIAGLLCRMPDTRVHMLGGEIDRVDEAAFGVDTADGLARFRVDLAFVGAGGISNDGDITDFTRTAADLRSRMIGAAARAYVVADRGKFGRLTPIRIAGTEALAGLVVDLPPPQDAADAFRARGTEVIIATGDL